MCRELTPKDPPWNVQFSPVLNRSCRVRQSQGVLDGRMRAVPRGGASQESEQTRLSYLGTPEVKTSLSTAYNIRGTFAVRLQRRDVAGVRVEYSWLPSESFQSRKKAVLLPVVVRFYQLAQELAVEAQIRGVLGSRLDLFGMVVRRVETTDQDIMQFCHTRSH